MQLVRNQCVCKCATTKHVCTSWFMFRYSTTMTCDLWPPLSAHCPATQLWLAASMSFFKEARERMAPPLLYVLDLSTHTLATFCMINVNRRVIVAVQ